MEHYQIAHDRDVNKWCIAPMLKETNGTYLVVCDSEAEAKRVLNQNLNNGQTPITTPAKFKKIGLHINGVTEMFKVI